MLAFRTIMSRLSSFAVRSFSTNLKARLRAASGRPPAGNDTPVTGTGLTLTHADRRRKD
jgi:hypothetical protein